MLMGSRKFRKGDGIVKQGRGWSSKWKFWKVSFTAASA
jgi:hypothetical protein